MIDSTYTVGSDPNSMRDQGTTRNAEYTFNDNCMNTIDVIEKSGVLLKSRYN